MIEAGRYDQRRNTRGVTDVPAPERTRRPDLNGAETHFRIETFPPGDEGSENISPTCAKISFPSLSSVITLTANCDSGYGQALCLVL